MDYMFLDILNMSLLASLVIVAVLLARLLLRGAPKRFSYALWAVVLFRLLCPLSFEAPVSALPHIAPVESAWVGAEHSYEEYVRAHEGTIPAQELRHYDAPPATTAVAIGSVIWSLGMGVMLLYSISSLLRLRKSLVGAVRLRGNVYLADHITSPFVIGVFRPKIYLPSALPEAERDDILLHEETHIRRRDHIVKLLAFLALTLHWFNPLVWLAFSCAMRDMEMSCDEAVLRRKGSDIRQAYSASLLRLSTGRPIIAGTPLAFGEGDTKGRVKNILRFKKPARVTVLAAVLLVAVCTLGLAVNRPVDRSFPMQGMNLADLETEEILMQLQRITGAGYDAIMVPDAPGLTGLDADFNWDSTNMIPILYEKNGRTYTAQLYIYVAEGEFYLTKPKRKELLQLQYDLEQSMDVLRSFVFQEDGGWSRKKVPPPQYELSLYLDALRDLPQAEIRGLIPDPPDKYFVSDYVDRMWIDPALPSLYYDASGVTEAREDTIWFRVSPLYQDAGSTAYFGTGEHGVQVFYVE